MSFIATPFGYMLKFLYDLVQNYGLAIVLFTILTKVLFYPLQLKSKKSMRETQKLQPKIKELQKRYATNKQKLNEEMTKLYQEENINPMGGCLPLLITLPIMLGLYAVIRQPLTYMLGMDTAEILLLAESFVEQGLLSAEGLRLDLSYITQYESMIAGVMPELKMNFLGLNLGNIPQNQGLFSIYMIVPVVAGLTSYLSVQISQKLNGTSEALAEAGGSMKMMMYMGPCMSLYFGYILPTGLGIYWITGNICMIAQEFLMNKTLNKLDNKNKTELDEQIAREKRNRAKELELKKEEQRRINELNDKRGK